MSLSKLSPCTDQLPQRTNRLRDDDTEDFQLPGRAEVDSPALSQKRVGCIHCKTKERILSFHQLEPGSHICMQGEHFSVHSGGKLRSAYEHHAIVKEVKCGNKVSLTLIHFTTIPKGQKDYFKTGAKYGVVETTAAKCLENDEIYVIKYHSKEARNHPDVLARATKTLAEHKSGYNLLTNNCEHFATHCVLGQEESFQVDNFMGTLDTCGQVVGSTLNWVVRIVTKYSKLIKVAASLADESAAAVAKGASGAAWMTCGFLVLGYLLYCCVMQIKRYSRHKAGEICVSCYKKDSEVRWAKFGVYTGISVASMFICSVGFAVLGPVGGVGVTVAAATLSSVLIARFPATFLSYIASFRGEKKVLTDLAELEPGSAISFKYRGGWHDGIVSEVLDSKGKLTVIHYAHDSVIGSRNIKEQNIFVKKEKVRIHDYNSYPIYPPEKVIERARERIGEAQYSVVSNRSSHFVHWAMVDDDLYDVQKQIDDAFEISSDGVVTTDDSEKDGSSKQEEKEEKNDCSSKRKKEKKKRSTLLVKSCRVRIWDEVQPGDVVQIVYWGLWHYVIVTEVNKEKSTIRIVHYGLPGLFATRTVMEDEIKVDLKKEQLNKMVYHPVHCYDRQQVVDNARKLVGEQKFNTVTRTSYDLAKECKLLPGH